MDTGRILLHGFQSTGVTNYALFFKLTDSASISITLVQVASLASATVGVASLAPLASP